MDVSDQLLHVRILVASARICHVRNQFLEAIRRWDIALIHVHKYGSFEGEGFTYAVIHLSKSLAYLEIGDHGGAAVSFHRGNEILRSGIRDYWIPTLVAWAEEISRKTQSIAGWP